MQQLKVGSLTGQDFFGNNKGMARPRKDKRLLMKASVRIMLTAEQKKLIEEAALIDQSDMTAWMRPILLRAAEDRIARAKGRKQAGQKPAE
jgi:hypothetical protein